MVCRCCCVVMMLFFLFFVFQILSSCITQKKTVHGGWLQSSTCDGRIVLWIGKETWRLSGNSSRSTVRNITAESDKKQPRLRKNVVFDVVKEQTHTRHIHTVRVGVSKTFWFCGNRGGKCVVTFHEEQLDFCCCCCCCCCCC